MASVVVNNTYTPNAIFPLEYTTVWVKRNWFAAWERVDYAIPLTSIQAAAPADSSAKISWDYGKYVTLWGHSGRTLVPLDIQNWMIKIVVHTIYGRYISWIGVVVGESMEDEGIDSATGYPRGVQTLECRGLEYLLERRRVAGTYVGDGTTWTYLGKTRDFNTSQSRREDTRGNRSVTRNATAGCYHFHHTGAVWWSNYDVAEYLLAMFQPWYPTNNMQDYPSLPIFFLCGQTEALSYIYQEHRMHGLSLRDAINRLVDRRRGLGWNIQTDGDNEIWINVFSLAQAPIVGESAYVPENTNQIDVYVDGDKHISARLSISSMAQVDEIIVESDTGLKVCASLNFADATIEEGWDIAAEEAYVAATDEQRASDLYSPVFSHFQVPKDYSWQWWSPVVDNFMNIDPSQIGGWWNHDISFLRYLPFEDSSSSTASVGEKEYREPFAAFAIPNRARDLMQALENAGGAPYTLAGAQSVTDMTEAEFVVITGDAEGTITQGDIDAALGAATYSYFMHDKAEQVTSTLGELMGIPAISMRPADSGMRLIFNSRFNHVLGEAHHLSGGWIDNAPLNGFVDYESMVATVFFETDVALRVRIPVFQSSYYDYISNSNVNDINPTGKSIMIQVPGLEFWMIAPHTVSDVQDGALVYATTTDPVIAKDDRAELIFVAMCAYVWYAQQRATVEFNIANQLPWFAIGDLIRNTVFGVWGERIGTVVTSIAIDYQACEQSVTTGYGEIDPVVFSGATS